MVGGSGRWGEKLDLFHNPPSKDVNSARDEPACSRTHDMSFQKHQQTSRGEEQKRGDVFVH